jgi:hypothetical protein
MTLVRIQRVNSANFLNETFKVYNAMQQSSIPCMNTKAGRLTGLTKEEEIEFEDKLGYTRGTLARTSPFWKEYQIKLTGKNHALNDEFPEEELALKVARAQIGLVAPSMLALKTDGRYTQAEFVVVEAESEAKAENVTFKDKKKAYKLLENLTIEDMRQILLVMGKGSSSMGNETVENILMKEVDRVPKLFINIVEDPDFQLKIFVEECAEMGILEKRGSGYAYAGELVKSSLSEMVDFLNDKSNNNMLLTLKQLNKDRKKKK